MKDDLINEFNFLAAKADRRGVIGFTPIANVSLLPEQKKYLSNKINRLGAWSGVSAATIGLLYNDDEMLSIPANWEESAADRSVWNSYAHAYTELNGLLNSIGGALAKKFEGLLEQSTIEGWTGKVDRVNEYFSHCVSHGVFAEASFLGWRGRHGLIVTPEAGPALRFATIFLRGIYKPEIRELSGCGDCSACVKACLYLRIDGDNYRDKCRQRLHSLDLDDEVCGICVRRCWNVMKSKNKNQ